MTRHDEILKIMREHYIPDLESNAAHFLTVEEKDELRRMKKDYHAEVRNRNLHPTLVIPGRGWEIRGPLTMEQVEQELIESDKESSKRRREVYGDAERFKEPDIGEVYVTLKIIYRDGDELYFFRSDRRSWLDLCGIQGYVIIRKNELLYKLVTVIN